MVAPIYLPYFIFLPTSTQNLVENFDAFPIVAFLPPFLPRLAYFPASQHTRAHILDLPALGHPRRPLLRTLNFFLAASSLDSSFPTRLSDIPFLCLLSPYL